MSSLFSLKSLHATFPPLHNFHHHYCLMVFDAAVLFIRNDFQRMVRDIDNFPIYMNILFHFLFPTTNGWIFFSFIPPNPFDLEISTAEICSSKRTIVSPVCVWQPTKNYIPMNDKTKITVHTAAPTLS